MSAEPSGPRLPTAALAAPALPAPALPAPSVPAPVVPLLAAAAATPGAVAQPHALPTLPAAQPSTKPNWKPIQRSKARKAINGLIGVGVLVALVVGARFAYESLAPAEDTTTPTTLLIDNPDTFVGQAKIAVDQTNANAPDQELLDLVGIETPPTTTP